MSRAIPSPPPPSSVWRWIAKLRASQLFAGRPRGTVPPWRTTFSGASAARWGGSPGRPGVRAKAVCWPLPSPARRCWSGRIARCAPGPSPCASRWASRPTAGPSTPPSWKRSCLTSSLSAWSRACCTQARPRGRWSRSLPWRRTGASSGRSCPGWSWKAMKSWA